MERSRIGTNVRRGVGLALIAVAGMLGGCAWGDPAFEQTTTLPSVPAPQNGLKVDARNGSISVHQGGNAVTVVATLRMVTEERLGQVTLDATPNSNGILVVTAKPPSDGWRSNEGCSFDITLPQATAVELTSSNGRIESRGMSGRGVFESSNGSVSVLDHNGRVHATTSNGRIEVDGATGPTEAHTSNGSVTVRLAGANPGPVKIDTSNGSVQLDLGGAFRGTIDVSTSNGSIHLPDSGGNVSVHRDGKNSASVKVGEGERSTIETSNGSVHVRFSGGPSGV